jgi:hypothetical protein
MNIGACTIYPYFVRNLIYIIRIIMLSVNFFCNISSYDILAYITKNYIALIHYAKIVHLLCQLHAGRLGFQLSVKLYIASPRTRGRIQS